jgi:lysyl-tRNA synthetase class 2
VKARQAVNPDTQQATRPPFETKTGEGGWNSPPGPDWRPSASLERLRLRAELAAAVRAFFAARGVLEVETPVLAAATIPEVHLASLVTRWRGPGAPEQGAVLYLQTSPEVHMKRLLAAGSGPIFQLARAFRDGEAGRRHNPEFTLLEWYRPGFDHHALMDEVEALLAAALGARLASAPAERLTYAELFARHAGLDPHRAAAGELDAALAAAGVAAPALDPDDRDGRLDLVLTHVIEPRLPPGRVTFVHDFPASQAALARVRPGAAGEPPLAERFEVYAGPLELANGFHELTDAAEQRRRFERDLAERRRLGLPSPPLDERFLAALAAGLPPCAGVALGFDRLVMLAAGAESIAEVLAFPVDRA